ncbi:MAG: PAS domain-containing protein [Alicyclobacillus sp.]|nr:PAS domain-containing protein [Alicyclobacillus sp.]
MLLALLAALLAGAAAGVAWTAAHTLQTSADHLQLWAHTLPNADAIQAAATRLHHARLLLMVLLAGLSLASLGLAAAVIRERRAQRQAEARLEAAHVRLSTAQRMVHIAHWEWDILRHRFDWPDELARLCGLQPRQAPVSPEGWWNLVHPDDRDRLRQQLQQLRRRHRAEAEFRILRPDGQIRYLFCAAEVMADSSGIPLRVLGTVQDITERKSFDALFVKAEKLASVGELAASVAHEIRNPLTAIKGFIKLLPTAPPGTEQRYLDIVNSELDRIESILNELLALAKPQFGPRDRLDLRELLTNVLTRLHVLAQQHHIEVQTRWEAGVPLVMGIAKRLEQALLHVLRNAMEAMPQGGTLQIQLTRRGSGALLRIADTGVGIPHDRLAKLGEPFYTTKEKGTGLGLAVTYKVIEQHGGTLSIESQVGVGTTVTIWLPAAEII